MNTPNDNPDNSNITAASASTEASVAFIGLGVMGFPMAGHLAAAGYEVAVYNRNPARASDWLNTYGPASEVGGGPASGDTASDNPANSDTAGRLSTAATPAEAAAGKDFVFVCVGADDDVRAVVYAASSSDETSSARDSTGALAAMSPGSVLVDHTTASAELARELHTACSTVGVGFIDAPVSGGEVGAINGALTVMCGGDESHFDAAAAVISSYAQAVTLLGPTGSGQLTKMVNQICIAGLVQGLSEGLDFAQRSGLDLEAVLVTISQGAAGSWQMENRGATMARDEFNFGFAVDWMRKDLHIVAEEAQRNGAELPITKIVAEFYDRLSAAGGGRWDTSSLIRLLR